MADLQARLQSALGSAYRIERELGGGGMSRVFIAEETELRRRVVVKVLPPELSAGVNMERFRREVQLAASLQHPHIVPLLTAGHRDDLVYYTMPLIEGESLRAKVAREGELPIAEAVKLLRDVADALAYAHEHGVVHRDIKPDNILVTRHHAVVTDFGVAKALSESTGSSSLTSVGVALGTPAYMAPEQAAADPHVDHRADIYALGALAYEMLTGRPPFTGSTPQQVLAAHVTQPVEPVTQHRAAVPHGLAELVMRCLEKKPADRWQTADELHNHLEAMATPSGGTTPTTAALAAPSLALQPQTAAGSTRIRRRLALVAVASVVLALAWGFVRSRSTANSPASTTARRLIVLPLENQGAPDREYFANGVTEAIIGQLTGIGGLNVIPRSTAIAYLGTKKNVHQIGEELGVGYVLEGTVQWEDPTAKASRVRVSLELIRVSDATNVWAHDYDAVMASVFQVYSDVASQVAQALDVALNDPERRALAVRPTQNSEAYDLYLRGNEYAHRGTSPDNDQAAVSLLTRAVALDSTFALAWASLAEARADQYWQYYDRSEQTRAGAKAAAQRALTLQPDLPAAHRAMGYFHYWGERDYRGALAEFALAQQAEPKNAELLTAVGRVQRRQGQWNDALASFKRAIDLDPGSHERLIDLQETCRLMRLFPDADRYLERAIQLAPDEPDGSLSRIMLSIASQGDTARAAAVARQLSQRLGINKLGNNTAFPVFLIAHDSTLRRGLEQASASGYGGGDSMTYYLARAELNRVLRQPALARVYYDSARAFVELKLKQIPEDYGFHAALGTAYAGLGRKAEALREGRQAVALLPPSRDAYFGVDNIINLAAIEAAVGDTTAAVAHLDSALAVPSSISVAWLRVDPTWDPLRANVRFQRLLSR